MLALVGLSRRNLFALLLAVVAWVFAIGRDGPGDGVPVQIPGAAGASKDMQYIGSDERVIIDGSRRIRIDGDWEIHGEAIIDGGTVIVTGSVFDYGSLTVRNDGVLT